MAKKRIQNENQQYKVTIYRELCSVEEFVGTIDKVCDLYMVHNGMVMQNSSRGILYRHFPYSGSFVKWSSCSNA